MLSVTLRKIQATDETKRTAISKTTTRVSLFPFPVQSSIEVAGCQATLTCKNTESASEKAYDKVVKGG